jgi:nucleoside-diphosphate-sugar epimerase
MKRILVTGASGYIGRACLDVLTEGGRHEVHAVSTTEQRGFSPEIIWHRADLLEPADTRSLLSRVTPTHLLHLAWYAVPGKFWSSAENYKWVEASLTLLREFAGQGGERVVMAGSCAEYDWSYGQCSEEETPLNPSTIYGMCKNSLHVQLDTFSSNTGLSSAWGRIFHLYGPHEPAEKLVAAVILSLLRRVPARCSHGKQIRDFLYVKDVASAFITLLESAATGAINIASGRPVALKDIITRLAEKLDGQELIQLGALPAAKNDPAVLTADVSRLSGDVGWQPQYDLDRGLDLSIEWWKSQLDSKGQIAI